MAHKVKCVDLLKRSLPIVAAAMGQKNGIKVVFDARASTAMTDGKMIVLPQLANDDDDVVPLVRGYIDHESAHIRYTDFSVPKPVQPVLGQLSNILEDVRIETAMFRQYPGAHDNMVQLTNALLKRDEMFILKPGQSDCDVLLGGVFTALQAGHCGVEEVARRSDEYFDEMQKRMPGLMPRIMSLAHEVADTSSTEDCIALATHIGDVIKAYEEEQRKEAQPPPDASAPDQGSDGGNGSDSQGSSPQQRDQAQAAADAAGSIMEAKPEYVPQCDIGAMASKAIGDAHEQAAQENRLGTGAGSEVPNPAPAGTPHIRAATVARHGAYLRARLQALIQAQSVTRSRVSKNGIRIADRLIHRVRTGDGRIFRSREVKHRVDTDVLVLADASGSMRNSIELVLESAMTVGLGLEGVPGAGCAIGMFPAGNTNNVMMLTRFDETAKATEKRFLIHTSGGTPMAQALWFAAQLLYSRKAPRKIVVVVTDGKPDDQPATKDVIARLNSAGIEAIGIGIRTRSVEELFTHHCVIDRVDDLGGTLINTLARHYCLPA